MTECCFAQSTTPWTYPVFGHVQEIPKVSAAKKRRTIRRKPAKKEDIARLLIGIEGTTLEIPTLIAMHTGMRCAEVLGLQWQDIDCTQGVIRVHRNVVQIPGLIAERGTKTDMDRVVPISASFADYLRERKGKRSEDEWVSVTKLGARFSPRGFGWAYAQMRKLVGASITFHELRHTQDTTLLAAGVSAKAVAEGLGHGVDMVNNVYGHVTSKERDRSAEIMEEFICKAEVLKEQMRLKIEQERKEKGSEISS